MSANHFIACDLGAESGRVMLGILENGRLELEEIHRFSNGPVRVFGTLRWDILRIFEELKIGLRKLADRGLQPLSLSVDSWGVDYALIRGRQPQISVPFNYRDSRTDGPFEEARKSAAAKIFNETGIQFMSLNTLYQLIAESENNREVLELADRFLLIGDYVNYLFSGEARAEQSLASTTQIYNPQRRDWSKELIKHFRLPERIFPPIVPSGTVLGPLLPDVAAETKLNNIKVVASCSHDTGAAVAAVPADEGDDWIYLSSGTWSLMGVELKEPLINEAVQQANFTNEAGFGGTTRFLKNISGLWLLQECRRAWSQEGTTYGYDELTHLALETEPLRSLVNPNSPIFVKPDDMPRKIQEFCKDHDEPVPQTPGQIARCVLESLAMIYRDTFEQLQKLTGRTLRKLHIVGGGSQSQLLNQAAADVIGCTVIAGPVEATAIGNVLIQAVAMGHLKSHAELRRTVRNSFPVKTFSPGDRTKWHEAYERFARIRQQSR